METDDLVDPDPKRHITWWQRIFYGTNNRVVYAVGLACFIGIALPIIIHFAFDFQPQGPDFGSCQVRLPFRFQCELNQAENTLLDLARCEKVVGCWEGNETLSVPYRCYHSVPPSYHYELKKGFTDANSAAFQGNNLELGQVLTAPIQPAKDVDKNLRESFTRIHWCRQDVLSIDFYPKNEFQPEGCLAEDNEEEEAGVKVVGTDEFDVEFTRNETDFFYYRISRKNEGDSCGSETLFDTRLGPMRFYEHRVTISTSLPSKHFYGIKGGQGPSVEGAETIDGITTFGQNELPFYMVREKCGGKMHGMLLETRKPFVAQVIDGPGISFELEGDFRTGGGNFSMKFFVGPKAQDVLSQLNSYLSKKAERNVTMPPYWGLGLHLCRHTTNASATLEDILHLHRELENDTQTVPPIPYDSDCVSDFLRTPFQLNFTMDETLAQVFQKLRVSSRRFLPSQKFSMKNTTVEKFLTPENMQMFILRREMNETFTGFVGGEHVNYISVFNGLAQDWMSSEFILPENFSGLVLIDNHPLHENASAEYHELKEFKHVTNNNSRIEFQFSNKTWGNVPPRAAHMNTSFDGENLFHLNVANVYGEESLKFFQGLVSSHERSSGVRGERTVVTSGSIWTESYLHGGFSGISVPFTWEGLRTSLSHLLRNFMFAPYGGVPICGSFMDNSSLPMDQDLCLRWYQVGLLLPFARNTYGEDNRNFSRGPLDLNLLYQKHLVRNIQDRYAHNPYLYTKFKEYISTSVPPILPLSFHFQDLKETSQVEALYKIYDQFMIGDALMAAPLVYPGTSRSVYFPPGLWYNLEGEQAYKNATGGGSVSVSALVNYVPMFIREGYIIPTLIKPVGSTAEESRSGNFTIVGAYHSIPSLSSTGSLYQDDGLTPNPPDYNYITFTINSTSFSLSASCSDLPVPVSTLIHEVRVFGFPRRPSSIRSSSDPETTLPPKSILYTSESKILRIQNLAIDFCTEKNATLTWEL